MFGFMEEKSKNARDRLRTEFSKNAFLVLQSERKRERDRQTDRQTEGQRETESESVSETERKKILSCTNDGMMPLFAFQMDVRLFALGFA